MPTQSDLDNLRMAIAKGVQEIQYSDGSRVLYQSTSQMIKALREMEALVLTGTPSGIKNRTLKATVARE